MTSEGGNKPEVGTWTEAIEDQDGITVIKPRDGV